MTALDPTAHDSPEILAHVHEGLPLVEVIAKQLRRDLRHDIEVFDLVSYGREGLLSAARSFEADRNVPFRRWANLRIRGAMIDGLRKQGSVPRGVHRRLLAIESGDRMQEALLEENAAAPPPTTVEAADKQLSAYLAGIATAMAVGFLHASPSGDPDDAPSEDGTPEELLEREQLSRALRKAITNRPDAERKLLERHYFDGATFDAVSKELGLSRSWASRLHARAIEGIAKDLKKAI